MVAHYGNNAKSELRNEKVLQLVGSKHPLQKKEALTLVGVASRGVDKGIKYFNRADNELTTFIGESLLPKTHLVVKRRQDVEDKAAKDKKAAERKQLTNGK
jgi:hypothetical protein